VVRVDSVGWNMYEFAERLSRFTEPFYVRLGDLRAILKGPRPPGRRWMRHPFRIHVAESSEAAPGLPSNRVPVAAQLLTLTYHPGLDLVVVFIRIREGDGARGSHSGSGMVVEMPRLHKHSPQHPKQRDADEGGSAIGREPSGLTARSPRRARRARRFRGRRNSVQTTSRSRCKTWRESLGALPSDAEDSPPPNRDVRMARATVKYSRTQSAPRALSRAGANKDWRRTMSDRRHGREPARSGESNKDKHQEGNLGQKDARLQKEKQSELSHRGRTLEIRAKIGTTTRLTKALDPISPLSQRKENPHGIVQQGHRNDGRSFRPYPA
jgi:hypothetical protein